ncbi:MAG: hypothetical protein IPK83_23460 [Planctomycetes bacterium]|nr:hypothetical protein [Planctomycetota bacterium]
MFQAMADLGHYRAPGQTRQGLYVCCPSGKMLASINSRDPAAVIKTLDAGLKAWNALSSEERRLPDSFPRENLPRWEDSYPEGGLVLATLAATSRTIRCQSLRIASSNGTTITRGFRTTRPVVGCLPNRSSDRNTTSRANLSNALLDSIWLTMSKVRHCRSHNLMSPARMPE